MPTGFTTVSAAHLQDASGTVVANATISFAPVDNSGNPISFRSGGTAGQVISRPITAAVSNGVFSVSVADTTLTTPVNVGYRVTVTDNVSGEVILARGYECVQPSGLTYSFDTYTPNLAPQVTVQTGPQGPAGTPGVASLSQLAAVLSRMPSSPNFLNAATMVAGGVVDYSTGGLGSYPGYSASDYIPANSGGQMVANFSIGSGSAGLAYYDQGFAYISGVNTIAANTPFSVPSTAAFLRLTPSYALTGTAMLVNGTTLPATYQAFRPLSPADAATMIAAATSTIYGEVVTNLLPLLVNLFDKSRITANTILNSSDGSTASFAAHFVSPFIPVQAGQPYVIVPTDGEGNTAYANFAWYDASEAFISSQPLNSSVAPFSVTAPAGAAYIRLQGKDATAAMLVPGTITPSEYIPFFPSADQIVTTSTVASFITEAAVSPLAGKRIAIWGDSITATYGTNWIPTLLARTGMTQVLMDAHAGRGWGGFFEDYGGSSTGVNAPVSGAVNTGGTAGNTLAQDLTATAPDIFLIVMGTNSYTIGSPGDTGPTSVYGYVYSILAALHTLRPSMRICLVGPYLNAFGGYDYSSAGEIYQSVQAIQYDANLFGDPFLNTAVAMGVNAKTEGWNGTTATAVTFTVDGTHPNAAGGARLGALIAEFLKLNN